MAINTWQDAIGTYATVRGYPDIVLQIKHIHQDIVNPDGQSDLRPCYGPLQVPAACVCEVVKGSPPEAWGEPCTPYGHYRVAAVDLVLEGETDS